MRRLLGLLACAGVLLGMAPAQAQQADAYPSKPVRMIVPVPAGGGVDTVTRIIAERLSKRWGQPVVVENRAGAAGNIGGEAVFRSEPDGYTLLASQPAPITINKVLYSKMPYDPELFETVAIMSEMPNVLLVRPNFPAKTAKEFLEYAKANPGKLNYASQGIGTTSHLTAELFGKLTGLKFTHVPYKGTAPALTDLIGGHVDFIFMQLEQSSRLHDSKKARMLATATEKRLEQYPDIPTLAEVGVKGIDSSTWNAISAPPKTPQAIIDKINADVTAIQKDPAVIEQFVKLNLIATPRTPAESKAFVAEEMKRWSEVVREAGIKPH
jgi:tripartite-type tricarboxylate transporter receptor subunit TctC